MKIAKLKIENGFTLIELIISIGLFVTVVTLGLGAVLGIFNANSKSQSMASVMNNLNYSLDSMSRDIRFSKNYHCGSAGVLSSPNTCSDNAAGDPFLAVTNGVQVIVYKFESSTVKKSVDGGVTYFPIIGSEVTVQDAKFRVFNTTVGDNRQPYVLLVIKGFAGKKSSTQSSFNLETFISQRPLDI